MITITKSDNHEGLHATFFMHDNDYYVFGNEEPHDDWFVVKIIDAKTYNKLVNSGHPPRNWHNGIGWSEMVIWFQYLTIFGDVVTEDTLDFDVPKEVYNWCMKYIKINQL